MRKVKQADMNASGVHALKKTNLPCLKLTANRMFTKLMKFSKQIFEHSFTKLFQFGKRKFRRKPRRKYYLFGSQTGSGS